MTADTYHLRTAVPEDWDEAHALLTSVFSEDGDDSDQVRALWEPRRTLLAIRAGDPDGSAIAGVGAAYSRDLVVPGATVPAAHVTMVGVRPTDRRRGLLRRIMHRQLADVHAAGEPVAVLWASEGRIYQRFGYGLATQRMDLTADHEVELTVPVGPDEGRLRAVPLAEAADVLAKVYDQVYRDRPGWSGRDATWWAYVLADPPSQRQGATGRRVVVHEGPSGVDGYALWRVKPDWQVEGPHSEVLVREIVAATPGGYRALMRFLLDVDLCRSTRIGFAPVDTPLLFSVNEPRRLGARISDGLWLRVVDLPAALAARRYAAPVTVTLAVADPLLPANSGTWALSAGPGHARCTRTDAAPDLRLDIGALGAAYLGGASLGALAAAGRVAELVPGTLAAAGTAFGWHRAPSTTETF